MSTKSPKCSDCGREISKTSEERSIKRFGISLCWECTRNRYPVPEEELEMI